MLPGVNFRTILTGAGLLVSALLLSALAVSVASPVLVGFGVPPLFAIVLPVVAVLALLRALRAELVRRRGQEQ
jgi:ABC-type transport system involved in multi-copper enzyme maturation permease subunit